MKVAMEVLESGFKETEIGLIPEDWEVVKLGEVVNFKIGRTPPRKNKDYWTNGRYYWVSISDMRNSYINNTSEMVSEKAHKEIFKEKLTPAGTLLMSFKLTIGRTAILNVDAYHNEAIISIYPKENKVLKEFLFYYLPVVDYSNLQDKAIKGNTLNTSKLNKILIHLPPFEEQKAIADILSTVQNAIEKTEKVINATKQLKKSMMKHLFTYGAVAVDEIDKVKLKESEIGLIPEHWEVVRLGEVGNYINGYAFKPSDWSNTGKPIIRIQNLNNPSASFNYYNGQLDYKYLVKKGDVLISWSASLGAYLWNGEDAWLNQHIFKVKLTNQNVAKDYLYFALLYYFVGQAFTNLHGSTMKHIVKSKFLNILIPLPPLEEQQKIAQILTILDQKIQVEGKKKRSLENVFKTLLNNLMTGKVRVKIF
jgi:type I restriction enzyme S subunit